MGLDLTVAFGPALGVTLGVNFIFTISLFVVVTVEFAEVVEAVDTVEFVETDWIAVVADAAVAIAVLL